MKYSQVMHYAFLLKKEKSQIKLFLFAAQMFSYQLGKIIFTEVQHSYLSFHVLTAIWAWLSDTFSKMLSLFQLQKNADFPFASSRLDFRDI